MSTPLNEEPHTKWTTNLENSPETHKDSPPLFEAMADTLQEELSFSSPTTQKIEQLGLNQITGVANLPQKSVAVATHSHQHQEHHVNTGEYLKSGVYGGLDGLINTLSIILGGIGAAADPNHILLIAIAGLIGDGISMGLGDYLSSKAENEFIQAERERELWETEHKFEDELKEMEDLYMEKGYSQEDSKRLGYLISQNTEAFVNIMMLEELGLTSEEGSPAVNGMVNFLCFVLFGFLPIIPFCINKFIRSNETHIMVASVVTGAFFLFFLGFLKSWLIGTSSVRSGLLTLILGSGAVAIGYGVGVAING